MKKKYKTKQLVVLTSGIATKRQMMEFAMKWRNEMRNDQIREMCVIRLFTMEETKK
jgi:hypothetical protein